MRNMRRKDREMSKEFALALADKCAYAVMATVSPDGSPYCVPLSFAREGEWLYFHCAKEGHKIDNLKHRNKVCVSCVGDMNILSEEYSVIYESAVIFGTAHEVTDRDEMVRALATICQRYVSENMKEFDDKVKSDIGRTGVWKIHIDEISGKERPKT